MKNSKTLLCPRGRFSPKMPQGSQTRTFILNLYCAEITMIFVKISEKLSKSIKSYGPKWAFWGIKNHQGTQTRFQNWQTMKFQVLGHVNLNSAA